MRETCKEIFFSSSYNPPLPIVVCATGLSQVRYGHRFLFASHPRAVRTALHFHPEPSKQVGTGQPGKSVEKLFLLLFYFLSLGRDGESRDERKIETPTLRPRGTSLQRWCTQRRCVPERDGRERKGEEHETMSQHIYPDKSRGCSGVIGTTWLVMRRRSRGEGGGHAGPQHSSAPAVMEERKGKEKNRAPSFICF